MRATRRQTTSFAVGRCAGSAAQHLSIRARYSLFMGVGRIALGSTAVAAGAGAADAARSLAAALPSRLPLTMGGPRASWAPAGGTPPAVGVVAAPGGSSPVSAESCGDAGCDARAADGSVASPVSAAMAACSPLRDALSRPSCEPDKPGVSPYTGPADDEWDSLALSSAAVLDRCRRPAVDGRER